MKPLPYRLFICGKHEVRGFAASGLTHMLSLEDPETPKATPAWFKGIHVQLHFHDVESNAEARTLRAQEPTRDHVAEILQFGQRCLVSRDSSHPITLLVHCYAGASRSTAAAYALACQALGKGEEAAALEYVLRLRPEAFPNLLIVKHADELLTLGGNMVKALAPLRKSFSQAVDVWMARRRRDEQG